MLHRRTLATTLTGVLLLTACGTERAATLGVDTRRADPGQHAVAITEEEPVAAVTPSGHAEEDAAGSPPTRIDQPPPPPRATPGGVTFQHSGVNPVVVTAQDARSTFALDVDTASYNVGRAWIEQGLTPDPASVRVEEWVNYFDQNYPAPEDGTFAVYADGAPHTLAGTESFLLRIGVAAKAADEERLPLNLSFVVDTSGSMSNGNRIALVREAISSTVASLDERDLVSIVGYDDQATTWLPPTGGDQLHRIRAAVEHLVPGGSTNAEVGLRRGYTLVDEMWQADRVNRVILLSDGVANVGTTDPDGLLAEIERATTRDIHLIAVGVGFGNFNDQLLEQLADRGDGWYTYLDSSSEARNVFGDQLDGLRATVARDARIQVVFDEDTVESYRLIGFENREIADKAFRSDGVDAGEVGAGHTVTALYELELEPGVRAGDGAHLATAHLRWIDPASGEVDEIDGAVTTDALTSSFDQASAHYRFTAAVATTAEILRGSDHVDAADLGAIVKAARRAASDIDADQAWSFTELIAELSDRMGR